ncbi:MAG: DUF1648 domain-containing protein [Defluviitaleaceae bacterium]|nr:DUF1648 domain-containing protein [Defluviitaleaceae bacterium]
MKRNKFDNWVDIICLFLLAGITVYLIVAWNSLPEQIPGHFAADGTVTRYDGRGALIAPVIISWVLYGLFVLVERFPQIWNTGVQVTEENKERVHRAIRNLISMIKLVIVAKFTFITIFQSLGTNLPSWFMPASIGGFFGTMVVCIMNLVRVSKSREGKES